MRLLLCLLLCTSLLGAMAFARRVFRLPAAFCPAVALAGQILCLYALSLPGFLKAGSFAVTLFGLAALLWCVLRERGSLLREILDPGVLFFVFYAGFMLVLNRHHVLTGYDNFTHWAVITKEMYLTDALPRAGTMVTFTNYPPATALYQYYVVRFLGFGERQMVLAMNVLGGAMVSCCFAGARWDQPRNLLARLVLVFAVLTVTPEHFRNLYVDALLGFILLAMGVLALWDSSFSKGTAVPQALLGALLILTKMSGAVLLILHAALLVVLKYRRGPDRPAIRVCLLALAGGCAAAYLSFHLHLRLAFGQALSNNQFQLSFASFAARLRDKSPAFWSEFPRALFHSFFSRSISSSRFFLLANLCLLVLFLAVRLRGLRPPEEARALIPFSWACVLFYSLCLAAMYVFMMSESDSIMVASFERYFGTIIIYELGLPFTGFLLDPDGDPFSRQPAPRWALCLCALACSVLLAGRLTWAPSRWKTDVRLNQAAANDRIFAAARQVELDRERPPVYVCVDLSRASRDTTYYVLRYAFLQTHIWPLDESYWNEGFYKPERGDPYYILWLEPFDWAEQALAEAGVTVPTEPGLYYKDADNRLTLVRTITY